MKITVKNSEDRDVDIDVRELRPAEFEKFFGVVAFDEKLVELCTSLAPDKVRELPSASVLRLADEAFKINEGPANLWAENMQRRIVAMTPAVEKLVAVAPAIGRITNAASLHGKS